MGLSTRFRNRPIAKTRHKLTSKRQAKNGENMILEKKRNKAANFEEIMVGNPFMEIGTNSGVYIKTHAFECDDAIYNAVRLLDASFSFFGDTNEVEKIEAKVIY